LCFGAAGTEDARCRRREADRRLGSLGESERESSDGRSTIRLRITPMRIDGVGSCAPPGSLDLRSGVLYVIEEAGEQTMESRSIRGSWRRLCGRSGVLGLELGGPEEQHRDPWR
jgi:hypothetical protein